MNNAFKVTDDTEVISSALHALGFDPEPKDILVVRLILRQQPVVDCEGAPVLTLCDEQVCVEATDSRGGPVRVYPNPQPKRAEAYEGGIHGKD